MSFGGLEKRFYKYPMTGFLLILVGIRIDFFRKKSNAYPNVKTIDNAFALFAKRPFID